MSRDRVLLYGISLIVIGLLTAFIAPTWHSDWINFWSGGATAGTTELLDPIRHARWQIAHHITPEPFVYPPGVAWLFVPAAHLSITAGFNANAVLMLVACALSALVASRAYAVPIGIAMLAVFAWLPATQAGFLGQFTPIALLLALLAIFGLSRRRPMIAGIAIGLLLYKPTDAVLFIALVLGRKQWRTLTIVAVCACAWYVAGVLATAADWAWPLHYLAMLRTYYAGEFARTALKTVSVPGLLVYAGASPFAATCAAVTVVLAALPALARRPVLEAASFAPLIGLAAGVHAYMYEAVLVVPALFYVLANVAEPWRWRALAAAYALAPLWVLGPWIRFDPLAIVVIVGSALWVYESGTLTSDIGLDDPHHVSDMSA